MFFLVAAILLAFWSFLSIKIVGPDEMEVKVLFGNPVAFCDSGFRFVPWFFGLTYLQRYPKRIYNLVYSAQEVVTKAGIFDGKPCGAVNLKINAVAYLSFPKEPEPGLDEIHPLIVILRAGVPIQESALRDWTQEAFAGALRSALGQVTWREAVGDKEKINLEVSSFFKHADGALMTAGFREKDIKLVISEIILPDALKEELTGAEAGPQKAKRTAAEVVGSALEMMARSHGVSVDEIASEVQSSDAMKEELRRYIDLNRDLSLADRRAFFEFRSPDAKGFDVLSLIALWKAMPGGRSNPTSGVSGRRQTNTNKKKIEDMTDEEIMRLRPEESDDL